MESKPDNPYIKAVGIQLTWSELNPWERVYNFSKIREFLNQAKQAQLKVIFTLRCLVTSRKSRWIRDDQKAPFVPKWVLDKHRPREFYTYQGVGLKCFNPGKDYYIKVAVPWDQGLQGEYARFIEEFGQQGSFENDSLAGIYLHGFSSSYGEEFWLYKDYLQNALDAGMTEESLTKAFKHRINWWVSAAGRNAHKLIWVDYSGIQGSGYDENTLDNYALKKGMGWRQGGLEDYHRWIAPELGQTYSDGYVTVDWDHPLRLGKRYFGEEIEVSVLEEDARKNLNFGVSLLVQKHLTESSLMRAAQLGMNYLCTSREFIKVSPEMFIWWTVNSGQRT